MNLHVLAMFAASAVTLPPPAPVSPEGPPRTLPVHRADTTLAVGTFEVTLTREASDTAPGSILERLTMAKRFEGDLSGSAEGEMLSVLTPVEGSAGYVAVERVTGTLDGRRGSFALQHSGIMGGDDQHHMVPVVPDSGTGDLTGIAGTMVIRIEGGVHRYELRYTLPPPEPGR